VAAWEDEVVAACGGRCRGGKEDDEEALRGAGRADGAPVHLSRAF
jgi:hypothetical protein